MKPNKTALFLIPAIPVGVIGGIMAMSGLGFGDTFGLIYSLFAIVYVIAYSQGSNDYRAFTEANKKKSEVYTSWTDIQKLDAIRDALLQCKPQTEADEGATPANMNHGDNDFPNNGCNEENKKGSPSHSAPAIGQTPISDV
jgi:hypothetical protein